jgi:capsular exopolysaccharide synthesis family protein
MLVYNDLQRHKDEIPGSDLVEPSNIFSSLHPAERTAESKWGDNTLQLHPDASEIIERSRLIESEMGVHISSGINASPLSETSSAVNDVDVFSVLPLLQVSNNPQDRLVCLNSDDQSPAAESFRLLGIRLNILQRQRSLRIVLITSTIPGEGKSLVAANLACTLARVTRQRTLLLEGDLRRPSLSRLFDLDNKSGLSECLQDETIVTKSIYSLDKHGLWILPAGASRGNPLELLQSTTLPGLIERLRTLFEWIIIDSPPVLPLADTSVWMRLCDGILLVTRQGFTRKRLLQRGIESIDHNKLVGAILNSSRNSDHCYYYNYSYTGLTKAT